MFGELTGTSLHRLKYCLEGCFCEKFVQLLFKSFDDFCFFFFFQTLCRFLLTVKKNYRNVAYHNWRHAFNVCQLMFASMQVVTTQSIKQIYYQILLNKCSWGVTCLQSLQILWSNFGTFLDTFNTFTKCLETLLFCDFFVFLKKWALIRGELIREYTVILGIIFR